MDKAVFFDLVIEVVRRIEGTAGFHVLPRRWVVERTFGWMMRWRRLVQDLNSASTSPRASSTWPSAPSSSGASLAEPISKRALSVKSVRGGKEDL
jgi:hypothetical protein